MTLLDYLLMNNDSDISKLLKKSAIIDYASNWELDLFSKTYCDSNAIEDGSDPIIKAFKKNCLKMANEVLSYENLQETCITDDYKVLLEEGNYKKLNLTYNPSTYELNNPEEDDN